MASHVYFDGIPLFAGSADEAVAELVQLATGDSSPPMPVRLVNAYSISIAQHDPAYRQLLADRGLNLCDGRPLAWVLRHIGDKRCAEQVRGPSLFLDVMDKGVEHGVSHYFLGGSEASLVELVTRVRERVPGIDIAGYEAPPFRSLRDDERAAQDEAIRSSGANLIWVGLGTPKQDWECRRLVDSLGVSSVGVGAAFDFVAGEKREAPQVMRRLGLEWLFRLAMEPRRLWRRYTFGNARFLGVAARVVWGEDANRRRS